LLSYRIIENSFYYDYKSLKNEMNFLVLTFLIYYKNINTNQEFKYLSIITDKNCGTLGDVKTRIKAQLIM
jgi:hypothetical protein